MSSHLRVSDEQRDRVAEQLREHYTAGRLTEEELSERVQAAYQARTGADLDALLADLPRLPASPAEVRAERAERRRKVRRRAIEETSGSFGAFGVCTLIWVATGANGEFWPIWVAIVPVMALFRNGTRLFGMASEEELDEGSRAERRELRRRAVERHRRR